MILNKELYTVSEVARIVGVSSDAVRLWINNGKINPENIVTLPSGHKRISRKGLSQILKLRNLPDKKLTIIYARESSSHQKDSLQRQIDILIEWANKNGISVDKVITDIASGMNFNRKGLHEIIDLAEKHLIDKLIISYKDRLARFGFEFFQWLLNKHGCEIIIVNEIDEKPDSRKEIIDDFVSIIHYFAMKLYGARSYKKSRLEKCIDESIQNDTISD